MFTIRIKIAPVAPPPQTTTVLAGRQTQASANRPGIRGALDIDESIVAKPAA
jgi:hypothetical protein